MQQQDVVINYIANVDGVKPLTAELTKVSDITKDLAAESKQAFATKTIDEATTKVEAYAKEIEHAVEGQKSLKSELRALKEQMAQLDEGSKEFKNLALEAARLEDKIGDVNDRVKRLASDTRTLDRVVDVAKASAAAFGLWQSALVAAGVENKNLEKALLRVSAATAALNSIQEIGQQLTTEGTALNKAYAFSLELVKEIQDRLKISSAAAFGLMAGGIGAVITLGAGLLSFLSDSQEETDKLTEKEREHNKELEKRANLERQIADNSLMAKRGYVGTDEVIARLKKGMAASNITTTELESALSDLQNQLKEVQSEYAILGTTTNQWYKDSKEAANSQAAEINQNIKLIQAQIEARKKQETSIEDAINAAGKLAKQLNENERLIGNLVLRVQDRLTMFKQALTPDETEPALITDGQVAKTDENANKIAESAKRAVQSYTDYKNQLQGATEDFIKTSTDSIFQFALLGTQWETQALESEKQKQLTIAGDNAKKREQIERDFAKRSAQILQKQAIIERAQAVASIATNTAAGVAKLLKEPGLPAAIPLIAFTVATGATQAALAIAKPLPQIPQFEQGGPVALAGGRLQNGYIIGRRHRQGGVLIEAEGTEYINKGPAVERYGVEIFDAANNLQLEPFIFKKFIAPVIHAHQQAAPFPDTFEINDNRIVGSIREGNKNLILANNRLLRQLTNERWYN